MSSDRYANSDIDEIGSFSWYTQSRLRRHGYDLLLKAVKTLRLAQKYETDNHLALDFSHNYILRVWLKDGEKTKVWGKTRYAERSSRILIHALYMAVKNEWFKKPVKKWDFNEKVSRECIGASPGSVNHFLKRKWTQKIFEVDDTTDTVKLLFLPKEILGVEELAKKS